MEPLIKTLLILSEDESLTFDFKLSYKIKDGSSSILLAPPCARGNTELFSVSLRIAD